MGTRSSSAKKKGTEGCTEEVLEQFNYPCASVHPGSGQGNCIVTLPCFVFYIAKLGQHSNRESCIMLENKQTCNLIAKTSQHSLVAVSEYCAASKEHCGRGYNWYVQTSLPNIVAPEGHQNDCNCVCVHNTNITCGPT